MHDCAIDWYGYKSTRWSNLSFLDLRYDFAKPSRLVAYGYDPLDLASLRQDPRDLTKTYTRSLYSTCNRVTRVLSL